MRLPMAERRVLIKTFGPRYLKVGKKEKRELLNEFVQMSGYDRSDAASLVRGQGKRLRLGPKLVAVAGVGPKQHRKRARKYDASVLKPLKQIWELLDYLCGKRLAALVPQVVPILEKQRELKVSPGTGWAADGD